MDARAMDHSRPVGSAVGFAGGGVADDSTLWSHPRIARPGPGRRSPLARLAASALRAHSLRLDCPGGWIPAPALHHAPRDASADLGVDSRATRSRICDSILGI